MTSSPRETELCQYHYDALDRLISHALADTPGRQRFYCKSRLTTEIQGAMRYSIVQQSDQLLAQHRSGGDTPDTTLLATDQQRSVLQTLKANHPPQPIAYSPYGCRPVGSGLLGLLGFNGERPDPVTGHYLLGNGYRAFNPVLMRFNSPDSWSPFGEGGLNPYAFCSGDPVNRRDPNGHNFLKIATQLVVLGRRAVRNVVEKTNTIVLTPFTKPPTIAKLKPDTTPTKAVSARAEMARLNDRATNLGPQNMKYKNDLTSTIDPERRKLLELIKEPPSLQNNFTDFSSTKLLEATFANNPPAVRTQARKYTMELMAVKNTQAGDFRLKRDAIRNEHFETQ